jgi:hypothetical protein
MRTAPALALLTVGAILAYAVNVSVPVVDVNTVGTVLALAGLLWLAVEIGLEFAAMRRRRPRRERPREEAPEPARPEAPYDPVIRSRRGEDELGRPASRGGSGGDDPTRVMPPPRG